MAAFHLRFPLYNVVSVVELLDALRPDTLVVTALTAADFDSLQWQDTQEVALPFAVAWARKNSLAVHGVFEPSPDSAAEADFTRYLNQYPQMRERLQEVEAMLGPVQGLLEQTLTLPRIQKELIPILRDYQVFREEVFEDGPGTNWHSARINTMAERILALGHDHVAVLASVDHVPFLEEAFQDKAELLELPNLEASEAVRERSVLDFAFRTDVPEPGNLIAKLREIDKPEARYLEANLLLAHGHVAEALTLLEQTSRGNFSDPYYLPAYVLARLGQLYDLSGQRDAALRAFSGVLALSYAPKEALEAASSGLQIPFEGLS